MCRRTQNLEIFFLSTHLWIIGILERFLTQSARPQPRRNSLTGSYGCKVKKKVAPQFGWLAAQILPPRRPMSRPAPSLSSTKAWAR